MNLSEIHIPDNADDALDWAARREYAMRYDAYREVQLREKGLREMFVCHSPEAQWIADMQHSVKV